jgi:hypothetical protein
VLQTAPATHGASTSRDAKPAKTQAIIPAEDLKPHYDFTVDCKVCQARLAAAQNDLTDQKTKIAALTKERGHALQIARGGSVWRRMGRAAKVLHRRRRRRCRCENRPRKRHSPRFHNS